MDKEKLIQRLMTTFLGELEEHVRALEQDLLSLDKDTGERRGELLHTLFRTAHSLKGAARSVSVRPIEAACHELEELLSGLRSGARQLSPELLQLLLATADALRDAERQLHAKESLSGRPIEAILSNLQAAARGAPAIAPAAVVAPVAAPAGVAAPAAAPAAVGAPAAAPAATAAAPAIVAAATAPAAVVAPSAPEPEASPRATPEARKDFARVSVDKLDALVARSGELLVARRRGATRQSDLAAIRSTLQLCRAEWQKLERPLRKLTKPDHHDDGVAPARGPNILPRRSLIALERTAEALRRLERDLDLFSSRLAGDQHALEQAAAPLDEDVRRIRMVPFADGCEGLERAVRDLARAAQKDVELVIEGGSVELDRAVLERLRDALLHLVRNAVDHGIELPAERLAAGKPARATLQIAASLRAGGVEISVQDDGRGINLDAVREQARRRKMSLPEDEHDLARLILLPGFSTAPLITELSGRGVGLDVVKHRVESLHGHVEFSSTSGRGTRFTLTVPLTLTTIRALLLQAGGQTYALPASSIRRLARVGAAKIASIEGREVLLSEGAPVPLLPLVDVLRLRGGEPHRSADKLCVVVIASGDRCVALAVDEFVAEQDVVVKTLGARLRKVRNIGGATVLPTGRLALILTPSDLVEAALSFAPSRSLAPSPAVTVAAAPKRLLVVDDSVTTRSLEKSILEAAGYDVMVAVDGGEAWQLLQEKGADLVVADVEMPHMDGFSLCETIRSSKRYRDLPVVLVTALASERDKARGLEVGADAYLVKGAFDQRLLLETVTRLT